MKKKLITIILALVLLVTMSIPALAATRADVEAALNGLRGRPQAVPHIEAALARIADDPSVIAGQEAFIVGQINAAAALGRRPDGTNIPFAELSVEQRAQILGHVNSGLNAIGLQMPPIDPANPQIPGVPPVSPIPAPPPTDDGVIRQTGFSADYSALLLVMAVLSMLMGAALFTSAKLRRGVER